MNNHTSPKTDRGANQKYSRRYWFHTSSLASNWPFWSKVAHIWRCCFQYLTDMGTSKWLVKKLYWIEESKLVKFLLSIFFAFNFQISPFNLLVSRKCSWLFQPIKPNSGRASEKTIFALLDLKCKVLQRKQIALCKN